VSWISPTSHGLGSTISFAPSRLAPHARAVAHLAVRERGAVLDHERAAPRISSGRSTVIGRRRRDDGVGIQLLPEARTASMFA
jgi:hypothetical protein